MWTRMAFTSGGRLGHCIRPGIHPFPHSPIHPLALVSLRARSRFCSVRLAVGAVLAAHGAHVLFGAFPGPGMGRAVWPTIAARYAQWHLNRVHLRDRRRADATGRRNPHCGWVVHALGRAAAALIYIVIGVWVEHRKWGIFLNWVMAPGRGTDSSIRSSLPARSSVCFLRARVTRRSTDAGRNTGHRARRRE